MRIALVVLEDFPGTENRVQRQALALVGGGHTVRIFCARGPSTQVDWHGIRLTRSLVGRKKAGGLLRRLWEYTAFTLEAFLWSAWTAITWRPQAIQFASMPDWLVFAGLVPRIFGSALVLDLHELMPELMDAKGQHPILRQILILAERISVKYADRVSVPTEMCAETLRSRTGVQPIVVLNAVDLMRFTPVASNSFRTPVVLGYHGTLAERFGVATVVEALAILNDTPGAPSVRLTIVGDGDARPPLEKRVDELGLRDQVEFTGLKGAAEIPALAADFDIGLVPMHDSEFTRLAYPTKAFEYAALGLPMLCTDMTSTRMLYTEDEVHFAVSANPESWAAAIVSIIENENRAHQRAMAAQQRTVVEYSWATWSSVYLDHIHMVTQSRPTDPI